jgi:phage terminase small subunit
MSDRELTSPGAFSLLNDKQQAFVNEYLLDWNGTRAAIRCGYSPKTARQQASRLLSHVNVQQAIQERKAVIEELYKGRIMDKFEVLARLSDQARGSLSVFMEENGTIDPEKTREIDREFHLLKKLEVRKEVVAGIDIVTTKIEIYDAQAALDKLGRYHALFTDKTDLTSGGQKLATPIIYLPEVDQDAAE